MLLRLAILLSLLEGIVCAYPAEPVSNVAASPPVQKLPRNRFSANIVKANPGPWGDVQWRALYIDAPDDIVDAGARIDPAIQWTFPEKTKAALHDFLFGSHVQPEMEIRWLENASVSKEGSLVLHPTSEELLPLDSDIRAAVYAELSKSPLNEYYRDPLIIGGSLDDWLRQVKLRPVLREQIRRLSYPWGTSLAFSDFSLLMQQAETAAEPKEIRRLVSRTRTLLGALQISPGSNLSQLRDYWSAGRPASDIVPLIVGAASRAGVSQLDIVHLLPAFARQRVYTFPSMNFLVHGGMPDCHWSSLNFFNSVSQDYYLDPRLAKNRLIENYDAVDSPYRLGDILCFLNSGGRGIHSCVYIADDVVFTKNGESASRPWTLMPLQDVRDFYLRETCRVQGYRLKASLPE